MSKYGKDTVELEIVINSSNDAFGDSAATAAAETARILREIADDIEVGSPYLGRNVWDINGNKVGVVDYAFTPDDDSSADEA